MASTPIQSSPFKWEVNRGRNPIDDPSAISDKNSRESVNVLLTQDGIGQRRPGVGWAIFAATGLAWDHVESLGFGTIYLVAGDVPINVGTDRTSPPQRILNVNGLGGSGFAGAFPFDAPAGRPKDVIYRELNGKLFMAYDSGVNRLHEVSGLFSIRTGLPMPAAPTVANTGAGAYAATLRYYRIQWIDTGGGVSSTRNVRGNLGTAVSFTPSGAGAAARVTRPATPANESITEWAVWGSADGAVFYKLSGDIAIATTTFDDNVTPSTYFSGRELMPPEGSNGPWPSVKYLAAAGTRLLGFGTYVPDGTTSDGLPSVRSRVYFCPVANTSAYEDDERISNTTTLKGWVDIQPAHSGAVERGLSDTIEDINLAFFDRGVWGLSPTGNDAAPFRRFQLHASIGACDQKSIFMGEDESGNPCVYFLDPVRGPYRYGRRGFEWLGYDVQDYCGSGQLIDQATDVHGVWDPILRACRWFVNCDANGEPQTQVVFIPRLSRVVGRGEVRDGWMVHDGWAGRWICSVAGLASNFGLDTDGDNFVVGGLATGLASDIIAGIANSVNGYDNPSLDPLDGNAFEGYVESFAFSARVPQVVTQIGQCYLQAKVAASVAVRMGIVGDFCSALAFANLLAVSSVLLTAQKSGQARILRKFPNLDAVNLYALAVRLGDLTMASSLVEYSTPGSQNVSAPETGVAFIECVGGGGASSSSNLATAQAGGGGGGYARASVAVVAGDTLAVTVGAGGAAAAGTGGTGGTSSLSVNGTPACVATGGAGGGAATGGAGGSGTTGDLLRDGGTGGGGGCAAASPGGGGGGGGGRLSVGFAGTACGAGGAAGAGGEAGPGGDGGAGGAANNPGNAGAAPGGGAGGNGSNAGTGAAGGAGLVRVRIFPSQWDLDRWLSSIEIGAEV